DGYLDQVGDTPDPLYPELWLKEGVIYQAGGGPDGEPVLTVDPNYGRDAPTAWSVTAAVFNDIGTIQPPEGDGRVWNMTRGRHVGRFFVDETVKAQAFYLIPLLIYSSQFRNGLFQPTLNVGFYDNEDGTWELDVRTGPRPGSDFEASDPFPWDAILNKWVEWDVRWRCATEAVDD